MQSKEVFLKWAEAQFSAAGYADFLRQRRSRRFIRISFWVPVLGFSFYGMVATVQNFSAAPAVVALSVIIIAAMFHKSGLANHDA